MYNCSYMHFRRQRMKIKEEMCARLLIRTFQDLGVMIRPRIYRGVTRGLFHFY
jgi:hypothetical protein